MQAASIILATALSLGLFTSCKDETMKDLEQKVSLSQKGGRTESDMWVENGRLTFKNYATANQYFANLDNKTTEQIIAINNSLNFTSRYTSNLNKRIASINAYSSSGIPADELENIKLLTPSGSEQQIPDDNFLAILSPSGEIGISEDTVYKTDGNYCLIYHKDKQQIAENLLKNLQSGFITATSEGVNINDIQTYKAIVTRASSNLSEQSTNSNQNIGAKEAGQVFDNGFRVVFELWTGWWLVRSSAGARTENFGYHCNWFWCDWYQRPAYYLEVNGVFDGYQILKVGGGNYNQPIGSRPFNVTKKNEGIAQSMYVEYTQFPTAPRLGFYGRKESIWDRLRTYSNHKAIGGKNNRQTFTQYFEW